VRVIAISGSPVKGGNTDTALEAVLAGARARGAQAELVRLYELDVAPCVGCEACQSGDCVLDDDAADLLARMSEAQAIVIGTPVYWYHVSSVLKTLLDRSYATFFSRALAGGRIAALIVQHSQGADETASFFRRWSLDQGCTLVEAVTIDTESKSGVVAADQELLRHLRELGARLLPQ
jgi:multimeric flavodoxin WrbA